MLKLIILKSMSTFSAFAKRHAIAIIFAFAIALIYGLPHIIIALDSTDSYHPILANEDEALFTAPKALAVSLGDIIPRDFNTVEYKDGLPYVLPFFPAWIVAILAKITGGIENAFIVSDFIFPLIIFLLIYLIFFEFTSNRKLAIGASSLFIFIPKILAIFPPVLSYLQALSITYILNESSLYFSRIEEPQITIPFFLLFIYLLSRSIIRKEKNTSVLAGTILGILFYTYFYYYVYSVIAIVIALSIALIKKYKWAIKNILTTGIIGFIISIPHWINTVLLLKFENYNDIAGRQSLEIGRVLHLELLPSFSYVLHALLIALLLYISKKSNIISSKKFLLISFLLPVYAVYNLQIVTGFNVHSDHWIKATFPVVALTFWFLINYFISHHKDLLLSKRVQVFIDILAIVFFIKSILTENTEIMTISILIGTFLILLHIAMWACKKNYLSFKKMGIITLLLIIILSFGKGITTQLKYVSSNKTLALPVYEWQSFEWLNKNTERFSVIGTPSFTTNARLSLYTHNRLFMPNGYNTVASDEEIWDRFLKTNALFKIPVKTVRAILESSAAWGNQNNINDTMDGLYFVFKPRLDYAGVYYLFHLKYHGTDPRNTFKSNIPLKMPEEKIKEKIAVYGNTKKDELEGKYRLDYLYMGPREKALGADLKGFAEHLEAVYNASGITIYKISR